MQILSGTDYTISDWKQLDSINNKRDPHTSYLLNESAVKALGWKPDQVIGKTLYLNFNKGIVKAVLKDFHFSPLNEPIKVIFAFRVSAYLAMQRENIRTKHSGNFKGLIKTDTYGPHRPFQYHFLDDNFNMLYHNDQQTAKIFSSFSILAISLACLGLFALAGYITVQRAREIGIRKVLGAGVMEIVILISKDFIKLIVIASVFAFPIAWLSMNSWLQGFAYRININVMVFLLAEIATTIIAFLTISFQAVRAAI